MTKFSNSLPFGLISVYNDSPDYLFKYFDQIEIRDNSDESNRFVLRTRLDGNESIGYIVANNPGHSLFNFLSFITENFQSLPSHFALLKSNIVPRHVDTETTLARLLDSRSTTPLFHKTKFESNGFQETLVMPNYYLERNNSSYMNSEEADYFASMNAFLDFIFQSPIKRDWIPFAPGACYLVTKDDCLRRPREFWEFMSFVCSYKFFPPEAYLVERALLLALTSIEKTHNRFFEGDWKYDLEVLKSTPRTKAGTLKSRVRSAILDLAHRF